MSQRSREGTVDSCFQVCRRLLPWKHAPSCRRLFFNIMDQPGWPEIAGPGSLEHKTNRPKSATLSFTHLHSTHANFTAANMHLVRSTQVHGRSHALAHLQAHSQRVSMPVSLSVNLPHNAHTHLSLSPHYQHHCSAHTLTVQAFHHSVSERRVITAWVSTQEQEMFIPLCVRRILESLNQDPLKLMPWDAHHHQRIGER